MDSTEQRQKSPKADWIPVSSRISPQLKNNILAKLAKDKNISNLIHELLELSISGRILGIRSFKK